MYTRFAASQRARAEGVSLLTIGIGGFTDKTELEAITGNAAHNFEVANFSELLSDAFREVFRQSIVGEGSS